jgi:hypothetical protein
MLAEDDTAEVLGMEVRRVRGNLPRTVELTDSLLAQSLPARVVHNEGGVDEQEDITLRLRRHPSFDRLKTDPPVGIQNRSRLVEGDNACLGPTTERLRTPCQVHPKEEYWVEVRPFGTALVVSPAPRW